MKKLPLLLASLLSALLISLAAGAAANAPRAVTANGTVEGARDAAGVVSYKGIPFAAPPVGPLRWKAPQPAKRWRGVRKADHFGPRAMQLPLYSDMVFRSDGVSEDCLYLNVWTPAASNKARLPVLVYFYGGGFAAGDGSEPRYDGAALAAKGIVTLTVNYRLNVFGFLAHPALTAESPHRASGNYGLMDQAAALQWVRRNIAAFGGDPARVTIAGESAGSWSVSAQMISPLAKAVIAGAIGESGSLLGLNRPPPLARSEQVGVAFAALAGAPTLQQLRAMPAQQLLETLKQPGAPWFGATQDGYVLPRDPAAMYAAGEQAHVPLLAGWNSHESSARAILGDAEATPENFAAALQMLYGERAQAARQAYLGDVGGSGGSSGGASASTSNSTSTGNSTSTADVTRAATDLASDRFISYGTWNWLTTHARTGGKPVYRYYFAHPRPGADGATHSAEIEYMLGNLPGNTAFAWTPEDHALSAQMQTYVANFIKTGSPDGDGLPAWPALGAGASGLSKEATPVMHFDTQSHIDYPDDLARFRFQDAQANQAK